MEKIRVINDRRYDIGLRLQNGTERVVKAGSYTLLPSEEIEYIASQAPGIFRDERQLRLEDRELALNLGFIQNTSAPVFDETEIRKQLSGRTQQIRAWLETIEKPYLLDEVYTVAMTMDLPASKLQLLQEKMPDREMVQAAEPS